MQKETVDKATAEQNTVTPAERGENGETVTTDNDKTASENDDEKRKRLIKEIETLDADFFNNVDVDEMSNDDLQTALDNMTAKNKGDNENE